MRNKTHKILLSEEERTWLRSIARSKAAPSKRERASILLKADENRSDGGWNDREISESFEVSLRNVQRIRKRAAESGLESVIKGNYHSRPHVRKIDGNVEASLVALCCGDAPEGRSRWTLKLLADKIVELEILDSVDPSTVQRCLKKTNLSLGGKSSGA